MTFGPRAKRFSRHIVRRVGCTVVLQAAESYNTVGGALVEVVVELKSQEDAELYEKWFQHLADCAEIIGDMPEDAVKGTLILTKGRS